MISLLCRDPGPTLVAIFGLGMAVGLLLATWIMYLALIIGRQTKRRNWIAEEQAALKAREERSKKFSMHLQADLLLKNQEERRQETQRKSLFLPPYIPPQGRRRTDRA